MQKKFVIKNLIFVFFLSLAAPNLAFAKPVPGFAGTLSIVPGLGQVANGDAFEGLAWFVTTVGLLSFKNDTVRKAGMNLWFYNMYDAYRDAGAPKSTNASLFENYAQNFNPVNIIDPIGAPIVAIAGLSSGNTASNKGATKSVPVRIMYYSFVGLGEEALFRGFLFPSLSSGLGSFGGAVASSAVFSAAHGQGGMAFVTRFVGGLLFCWQVNRNKYNLGPSIFAHTWFDFLLSRNGNLKGEIEIAPTVKYSIAF